MSDTPVGGVKGNPFDYHPEDEHLEWKVKELSNALRSSIQRGVDLQEEIARLRKELTELGNWAEWQVKGE